MKPTSKASLGGGGAKGILAEDFFKAQEIVEEFNNTLVRLQPKRATQVAFAILVLEKHLPLNFPNWREVKNFCERAFAEMEKSGIFPEPKLEGEKK
jgi:hypothetical protein